MFKADLTANFEYIVLNPEKQAKGQLLMGQ